MKSGLDDGKFLKLVLNVELGTTGLNERKPNSTSKRATDATLFFVRA